MDEKDIEIFLELMQTGNVTRAADNLFTTQSAVTKRIQRMEEDLGCPLFIRTKRGMLPTAQAEHILPAMSGISRSLQDMRSYTSCSQGEISGSVRLGSSINYAHYRLAPLLKDFMEAYPRVDVSVTTGQSAHLFKLLSDGQLSLVILRGDFAWNDGCIRLGSEPVCLVRSRADHNKDLSEIPFIRRKSDPGFEAQMHRWITEHGIRIKPASLEINDISACLAMVAAGIGWTILPEICLSGFDGICLPLSFKDGTAFTRSTHLFYRQSHLELAQIRCFIERVLAYEHG